jgi:hypothetical protein
MIFIRETEQSPTHKNPSSNVGGFCVFIRSDASAKGTKRILNDGGTNGL